MLGLKYRRRTWTILLLANLGLLALFGWTLTESTSLRVTIDGGLCTAILSKRTNSVPCPGVEGGQVGLYNAVDNEPLSITNDPWRQFFPSSSWRRLTVAHIDGTGGVALLEAGRPRKVSVQAGEWHTFAGELRPLGDQATLQWDNPLPAGLLLEGELRRPGSSAGLLLLQPDGDDGWLFLYNSETRLGTWWRWQDGRAVEPLLGAPLQKSLTAQIQSLMRVVLLGHQAGLLLLLATWLLALILAWLARRFRQPSSGSAEQEPGIEAHSAQHTNRHNRIIVVALLLWVFAWSMFISNDLLGSIPHVQDSITYRFQAQTLARGHLTAPAPPEPAAFEQEFMLVKDGRWFGKYPPGYPLLLAVGELLGLSGSVNPLLATLTVALLFVLGKLWYARSVGLIAAFLAAISPFLLIMSGNYMAHTAELFWITLFMVAWTRVTRHSDQRSGRPWSWLLGAGVALGMVFLTRQLTALAVAAPFALATTVTRPKDSPWSRRIRDLLALAVIVAPLAALLLAYQAAVAGDPFQDPRLLFWSYDHLGFGQDIGQGQNVATYETVEGQQILVWQHDPTQPSRGHNPARGVFNLERNWRHLQSHLFGWLPLFTLAFAWSIFVLGRARRADWIFLVTATSLMLVYVFYWADGVSYGPRYFYAALPALFLLVARGIQSCAAFVGGQAGRWAVGLILATFVIADLLVYFPSILQDLPQYNFVDSARVAAVESAVEEPALIFVGRQTGDWWEYGTYFTSNTPWLDGPIIYARDLGPAANDRLRSHYPERNAYLLQDSHLQPLTLARP